ncbi:hypothetical protein ACLOJK_013175 [Asimina triloba]
MRLPAFVHNKADDQHNWRVSRKEKLAQLRQLLRLKEKQLSQGKAELEKISNDLKVQYALLESASTLLERNRVEQLEKFYSNLICTQNLGLINSDGERKDGSSGQYDQICNARLPKGLDPHSVPSEELAASLGNEYPLFIPRQNSCSAAGDSWSDRSSSNFGFTSVESEKKPLLEAARSSSFNYSSASPHSVETHKDLQKGISLLKKSVACITAYCYNSLYLDIPSEVSTFEAFAKLLSTLSSSREIRSVLSLKMAPSRYVHLKTITCQTEKEHDINEENHDIMPCCGKMEWPTHRNTCDNLSNSAASFLSIADMVDARKSESLAEGWDIVEHPTFPPPPSQAEDIEHWTRAMITDATKR